MVLSGTLREFILADVFQLLAQQKITGKLVLLNGKSEGLVVFKNGTIVAAEKNDEKFTSKLFNYIVDSNQQQPAKIREFFATYEGDVAELTREINGIGYLRKQDISSFAESVTEDVACSLFLWKTGTYRFNSVKSVDPLIPAEISIQVENIVMEAMRRIDEWNRMQEYISHDSIFVRTEKEALVQKEKINPLFNMSEYVYSRINGISPVEEIINTSCLTEFKAYESLNSLIQNGKITPLSEKLTSSVQAAIEKKVKEQKTTSYSTLFSILATIGIILLVLFMALVIFRGILFPKTTVNSYLDQMESSMAQTEYKTPIARVYFHAVLGVDIMNSEDLRGFSSLTSEDIHNLNLSLELNYKPKKILRN